MQIEVDQGVLPREGWVVTAYKLNLRPLRPLSVAGCGQLQLGASHWAISITACS